MDIKKSHGPVVRDPVGELLYQRTGLFVQLSLGINISVLKGYRPRVTRKRSAVTPAASCSGEMRFPF